MKHLWFSTGSLVPRWKAAMLKPNNSYDFFWKSNFSDVQMSASKALRNNSFELCSRPLIDSASNTRHRQMSSHISRQWVSSFLISSTHPECQDPESTVYSKKIDLPNTSIYTYYNQMWNFTKYNFRTYLKNIDYNITN